MSAHSTSADEMIFFPSFEEDGIEQLENTAVNGDSSGNGLICLLSNLFRPNSSSRKTNGFPDKNIQQGNRENQMQIDVLIENLNIDNAEMEEIASENGKTDGQTLSKREAEIPNCIKMSESKRYWMPDAAGVNCYDCETTVYSDEITTILGHEKFTTFRRRHHCRLCGQIFCKNCANRQVNANELGYYGILRLCNFCGDQMEVHVRMKRDRVGKAKSSVTRFDHYSAESNNILQNASGQSNTESQNFLRPSTSELGFERLDIVKNNENGANANHETPFPSQTSPSLQGKNEWLEGMFEEKLEHLLDTLLLREEMESKSWKGLLWTLGKKVTDRISALALANTAEAQDILDFLHIKKLHMEVEPKFELINGVAFSKCLADSRMPLVMKNISLMLINGKISYERVLEKFSTIEPILQQERQFLRLQCDRILSTHVSLLVSENPVPVTMLELLFAEQISVIANVKKSVLKRIGEATGTDILNSLDAQFLQPRLGFVADFSQREFVSANGQRKQLILMENCSQNFGPTIFLKGRNMRELIAAKRILRFLVMARHSSNLEIALLSLFNSIPKEMATKKINAFQCHICELNQRNARKEESGIENGCQVERMDEETSKFLNAFSQTQLTNSPVIHFSPPFLKTYQGRHFRFVPYFKLPVHHYLLPEHFAELRNLSEEKTAAFEALEMEEREARAQNASENNRMINPNVTNQPWQILNQGAWRNFRSTSALNFRRKMELNRKAREQKLHKMNDLLNESEKEAQLKYWAKSDVCKNEAVLNPYNHQGLAFLFCANLKKAQNVREFCMGPYVLNKTFYDKEKDTSLGRFLLNYCFNVDYRCKTCDRSMQDHFRRIVHRNARVEISTYNVGSGNRSSATFPVLTNPFGAGSAMASAVLNGESDLSGNLPFDELPSAIPNNNCQQMICWLRCTNCSANSSIVPMPDTVFHLSFAKFIDYLTNGTHWVSPFPSSIDLHQCLHCTFHSHSHFFALGNLVTAFRVSPVYPLNVLFNPIPCTLGDVPKDAIEWTIPPSIREISDTKGVQIPDIGSIIANALGSEEYANKLALLAEAKDNLASADFLEITAPGNDEQRVQCTVKIYFAEQFQKFRSLIFADGEKSFLHSLATSSPWYPQGGKSGASFFRTDNERFVLKTLSRFELDSLKNCVHKYIDYVSMATIEHKLTALCKIFGAYGINYTNKQTGQTVKNDYLVMEYIFYKKDIKQIWDLKGSLRNRFATNKPNSSANAENTASSVLLDENYIQDLWRNQIYLTSHSKAALSQAIINDSNFLSNQGIMDYSLLAGISRSQEDEVIIGIVDYMRTFTLDKKVESLVKTALPISNSPTVISPENYCKRFYERIDGYFAVAPDQWTSESPFS